MPFVRSVIFSKFMIPNFFAILIEFYNPLVTSTNSLVGYIPGNIWIWSSDYDKSVVNRINNRPFFVVFSPNTDIPDWVAILINFHHPEVRFAFWIMTFVPIRRTIGIPWKEVAPILG